MNSVIKDDALNGQVSVDVDDLKNQPILEEEY